MTTIDPSAMTIRSLIERDLSRQIEGIVKVNQDDEETVHTEITEYVPTEHIRREYRDLFEAVAEGPQQPSEGVGIWVSGFFGSGKSSFAKNFGYALKNPSIAGRPAAKMLGEQLGDREIARLLDLITDRQRPVVVMFDVTSGRAVKDNREKIAEIVFNETLRELGYPADWLLADLEFHLEEDGEFQDFLGAVAALYPDTPGSDPREQWARIAKSPTGLNKASAALHRMDPSTYPAPDSWAMSKRGTEPRMSVSQIVTRIFDMMARRRPLQGLVYVVDEVGQYVGRSTDKIEDLRALVEQFGKESANRVRKKRFPAPVWFVVTSQERLDEVVNALDGAQTLLPKLEDRFEHRVDLVPTDIREVATKRVLGKTAEGLRILEQLYAENEGRLRAHTEFEQSSRPTSMTPREFADFYPYLPHFIDLSIDIMTGIRARSSSYRQTGAANRTLIRQAYEMLTGEPDLAEAPVGTLVTLDRVYDLVRHSGAFDQAQKMELDRVEQMFGNGSWEERVVKALNLLEFVRHLPRTPRNIAATLYDRLGADSPLPAVESALRRLADEQFVRETEDGWKLQTVEEKTWDAERNGHNPRPRDLNETVREAIGKAFDEESLRTYKHQNRNFKVGLTIGFNDAAGTRIGDEGPLTLQVRLAEDRERLPDLMESAKEGSRSPAELARPTWTAAVTSEIEQLARDLLRSRSMVHRYDMLAQQGKISPENQALLQAEKMAERKLASRLEDRVGRSLRDGTGFHAGSSYSGGDLGQALPDTIRGFLGRVAPQVFPELVSTPLTAKEIDKLLTEANLNNMPVVLHAGSDGLGFIVQRDGAYHIDPEAGPLRVVLDDLRRQQDYGQSRTGKELEQHFGAAPYGWEGDMVRLAVAALLRAGRITVLHQGKLHKSHHDPAARAALTGLVPFRSSTFAPRKDSIGIDEIDRAVRTFQTLTGEELEYDADTIARAYREQSEEWLRDAGSAADLVPAHGLPRDPDLDTYVSVLQSVRDLDTEDAVLGLAGAGEKLRAGRDALRGVRAVLDRDLQGVKRTRTAVSQMWPALRALSLAEELAADAEMAQTLLSGPELYSNVREAISAGSRIAEAYETRYRDLHWERGAAYDAAIERVRALPNFAQLQPVDDAERSDREADRAQVLDPLEAKRCELLELDEDGLSCRHCRASLGQLDADLAAVDRLESEAADRLWRIAQPVVTRRSLRAREVLGRLEISDEAGAREAADRLYQRILEELGPDTIVVVE